MSMKGQSLHYRSKQDLEPSANVGKAQNRLDLWHCWEVWPLWNTSFHLQTMSGTFWELQGH